MEMKDRLQFREKLFVTGETARLGVRPEAADLPIENRVVYDLFQ